MGDLIINSTRNRGFGGLGHSRVSRRESDEGGFRINNEELCFFNNGANKMKPTNIVSIIVLLLACMSNAYGQNKASLLQPAHQARFIDGIQAQAAFSDSAGKFTIIPASIISPIFIIAELDYTGGLGSGRFNINAVTLGIGHVPFSLGPIHLSWQFKIRALHSMSLSGLLGIATNPLTMNFGYHRIIEENEAASILNEPDNSFFANVRFSPVSWLSLEGEVEGIADRKARWEWLRQDAVYHAGISFRVASSLYISGFLFDMLGLAERRLGLTYVLSTTQK